MEAPADAKQPPSRYMRPGDVADQLCVSRATVHNKIKTGQLVAVDVATGSGRRDLRITRDSFDAYCQRLEYEARQDSSAGDLSPGVQAAYLIDGDDDLWQIIADAVADAQPIAGEAGEVTEFIVRRLRGDEVAAP